VYDCVEVEHDNREETDGKNDDDDDGDGLRWRRSWSSRKWR
jgi:hypothetical protein